MSTLEASVKRRPSSLAMVRSWWVALCFVVGLLTLGVALLGPYLAPYSPNELAGQPYSPPSGDFLLGTDSLGRDVLTRVLWGGRLLIVLAVVSTLTAYAIGAAIGLVAAFRGGGLDSILMRSMDAFLALPSLLFLLLLASSVGPGPEAIILGIALIQAPGIARIVRAAALEISVKGYVEAAVARGERTVAILTREIAPNIAGTVAADAGLRFTGSFLAIAALNFLGLGLQPPTADWATMISFDRAAISIQPWTVAAPAIMIASFTIAVNVVGDAFAGSLGRSSERG